MIHHDQASATQFYTAHFPTTNKAALAQTDTRQQKLTSQKYMKIKFLLSKRKKRKKKRKTRCGLCSGHINPDFNFIFKSKLRASHITV
jgi:hypothetical protein